MEDYKKESFLIFIPTMELGGAENQAFKYAKYLKKNNYDVILISPYNKGALVEMCLKEHISLIRFYQDNNLLNYFFSLFNKFIFKILKKRISPYYLEAFYFSKYVNKNTFDYILSYCAEPNIVSGLSKIFIKNKHIKHIWFQRDALNIKDNQISLYLRKKAFFNMDFVLANSSSTKEYIKDVFDYDCKIVYNGFENGKPIEYFDFYSEYSIPKDSLIVTMVGNLHHNKNHIQLLKAWNILINEYKEKNVILLLAGYISDSYSSLKKYVDDNALSSNMRFLGQVKNIPQLLSITDIFAFASLSEGSPNSVIEACAYSLPVVSNDLPVIRDIVCEENHLYLDTNDSTAMARNLLYLLKNKEKRELLGKLNRENVENKFNYDKNFSKLTDLIIELK